MNDLAKTRSLFLAKVEGYASGQASRFATVLDELIRWSELNNLTFTPHAGIHELIKYSLKHAKVPFWCATPRTIDGAKFTLLNDPNFPEPLRNEAREELARIDGKKAISEGIPEMAFTKLLWKPYREQVFKLMDRLLAGLNADRDAKIVGAQ